LEQCERFLRLRLAERAGHDIMDAYGDAAQRIAPLVQPVGHNQPGQVVVGGGRAAVNIAASSGWR